MTISYAIPVCNEHEELDRLLTQLINYKRSEDRIEILVDASNTTYEVSKVLTKHHIDSINYLPLNGDFASFKNHLKNQCLGDWIFQIDADEYLPELFIKQLPYILQENPTTDLFLVPRINTVEGLTDEHIKKWGWRVDERGWVNFPDYQTRILQNNPKIGWAGKVHEVLTGHKTYAMLPAKEEYCLIHNKQIERQERQNAHYDIIQQLKNG